MTKHLLLTTDGKNNIMNCLLAQKMERHCGNADCAD